MRFLEQVSVMKRLIGLIAVALLGLGMLSAYFLFSERSLLLQERQTAVRFAVETANEVLVRYEALAKSGQLSEDEAKAQALALLGQMRYDKVEYFWVNDMQPRMVMHPIKPELNGKDLAQNKDAEGKPLFVAFVDVVKAQGAGYVSYLWPKPGSEQPVPKVSYVKGFAPWGWVLGSGVYVDNLDAMMWQRLEISLLWMGGVLLGLAALGVAVARSLSRQLGGEPAQASALAHRMAQGDLSQTIPLNANDQDSIMHAMAQMQQHIGQMVSQVRSGAHMVANAASEIAQGNQDLSSRTESQASALQQSAASMEELGVTVQNNASHAQGANQLVQHAAQVTEQAGGVVAQVVQTMEDINHSSRKIADIIAVIDGIAFQTNILALNAAVEAARAGEQGRGFAVVAGEVRSLAQRSAEAAKEIKILITDSVDKVAVGSALVERAGSTMQEAVASIGRVTQLVRDISHASTEQSQGVAQVGEAVSAMDQVTQQNAALVEEMAAAAAALNAQAQALVQTVDVFKLR